MASAPRGCVIQFHECNVTRFYFKVSNGRIIVMTVKDEGTFHLKQAARDLLERLGSTRSHQISWRDMWAFVTLKKGSSTTSSSSSISMKQKSPALGESLSKSPDFSSWGQIVRLRAEVPLSSPHEVNCQKWLDTDENR